MKRQNMLNWGEVKAHPWLVAVTPDEVRNVIDQLEGMDELTTVLDEAQGPVFTDEEGATYLVVKITKSADEEPEVQTED